MDNKLKIKSGDQLFFSELIERYQHQVYQICFYMIGNRKEAAEVAQLAFIEIFMNVRNYNSDKVSSKLFCITAELAMEWLYEEKTNKYLDYEIAEPSLMEIQKEILQLTVNTRLAIILNHIVGLSIKEISDIMYIPISSVREKIHHGREILLKRFKYNK